MQINENLVRERAYKIWEAEGRPEGCAEKHWSMAREQESVQDDQPDSYKTLGEDDVSHPDHPHHKSKHKKGKHNHH